MDNMHKIVLEAKNFYCKIGNYKTINFILEPLHEFNLKQKFNFIILILNIFSNFHFKFSFILQISDENSLKDLSNALTKDKIQHKLWIEQPENISTCIALKVYNKEEVNKYFKKLKLFKGGLK